MTAAQPLLTQGGWRDWPASAVEGVRIAWMEDVLDLYAEPPDPNRPVVCFDESPTQLIGEVRTPIPAKPGQLERYDCEYRRNGTANLFVFVDLALSHAAHALGPDQIEDEDRHCPKQNRREKKLDGAPVTLTPCAVSLLASSESTRVVLLPPSGNGSLGVP
jgi:hypothetical protein